MKISTRQKEIVNAIVAYVEERNYPPTTREIGELVNLKSSGTVHGHLNKLRRKGYLDWEEGKPRTLKVLKVV